VTLRLLARTSFASVLATLAAIGMAYPLTTAQVPCELGAITLEKLKEGLARPLIFNALIQVNRCGVTFILDEAQAAELRRLGAAEELIQRLMPPNPTMSTRWTPLTDGREVAWIPAGRFTMGSPPDEAGHQLDETLKEVSITSGFWLDRNEVTNEAYLKFVKANGDWAKGKIVPPYLEDWTAEGPPADAATKPVTYVTWAAAEAYAKWAGKRLPTEMEWEYAARASRQAAYWWGPTFEPGDVAKANNGEAPRPVGLLDAVNSWGLFDMLGNVWEWTSTPYDAQSKIARGGSFGNMPASLRAARRLPVRTGDAIINVGFRCALSVGQRSTADR
jgi:formylglycine-generating enzyme required for sulfatase activity